MVAAASEVVDRLSERRGESAGWYDTRGLFGFSWRRNPLLLATRARGRASFSRLPKYIIVTGPCVMGEEEGRKWFHGFNKKIAKTYLRYV